MSADLRRIRSSSSTSYEIVGENEPMEGVEEDGTGRTARRDEFEAAEKQAKADKDKQVKNKKVSENTEYPPGTVAMIEAITKMAKSIEGLHEIQKGILFKLSNIELRQSTNQGEGTDAIRCIDQWARAESALVSRTSFDVLKKRIMASPEDLAAEAGTYTSLFLAKDARRGHYIIIMFYKAVVEKEMAFSNNGSEYTQGWGAVEIPELREMLLAQGVKLPKMSPGLEAMLDLSLPLDRGNFCFKYSDTPEYLAPKKSAFRRDLSDEKVLELVEKLPPIVREIMDKMPKGTGEDVRETMMNAAVYYNDAHARWHKANKIINKDEMLKKKAKGDPAVSSDEIHRLNKLWAESAEFAMTSVFPDMFATIEQAEMIEGFNRINKRAAEELSTE